MPLINITSGSTMSTPDAFTLKVGGDTIQNLARAAYQVKACLAYRVVEGKIRVHGGLIYSGEFEVKGKKFTRLTVHRMSDGVHVEGSDSDEKAKGFITNNGWTPAGTPTTYCGCIQSALPSSTMQEFLNFELTQLKFKIPKIDRSFDTYDPFDDVETNCLSFMTRGLVKHGADKEATIHSILQIASSLQR